MTPRTLTRMLTGACVLLLLAGLALADDVRPVGKSFMFARKPISFNLIDNPDFSTLARALKVTKLERALLLGGSFTLLAPDNAAFAKIPPDELEHLFRRVNLDELARIVACHVIANNDLAGAKLLPLFKVGKKLSVVTLGGCVLTAELSGGALLFTDETGAVAHATLTDIVQSNGMIEIIDGVIRPKS